ncbi:hypothetical protein [Bradyrhizobium sp. LVM 105]|nr:hypothetical protein [Bradyrhizobium sp. LVM 105]
MTRDTLIKCGMNALVVALAASIPFGIAMTFYMDDAKWLWFCAPILIFLS